MNIDGNVYQDIEKAKKIINLRFYQTIEEFSKYCSLYAFTNENIQAVYNYLDVKDKSILTAAGSGDHIFEAYAKGAKKVNFFDINCLTPYYIDLKKAGIMALPEEEFIEYFCCENPFSINAQVFHISTYEKLRNYLDSNNRLFWDSLYQEFKGIKIRKSKLFYSTEEHYDFLKVGLSYLQPQNYQKLQQLLLKNSSLNLTNSFINCNLTELPETINTQFDIIYLSNIPDYLEEIFCKPYIDNFKLFIKNKLDPMLADNGKMVAAYMFFAEYNYYKNIPLINRKSVRKTFSKRCYEEWIVDNSTLNDCTNDLVLIYKKTR